MIGRGFWTRQAYFQRIKDTFLTLKHREIKLFLRDSIMIDINELNMEYCVSL